MYITTTATRVKYCTGENWKKPVSILLLKAPRDEKFTLLASFLSAFSNLLFSYTASSHFVRTLNEIWSRDHSKSARTEQRTPAAFTHTYIDNVCMPLSRTDNPRRHCRLALQQNDLGSLLFASEYLLACDYRRTSPMLYFDNLYSPLLMRTGSSKTEYIF